MNGNRHRWTGIFLAAACSLLCCLYATAFADPRTDLGSPSQEVRDKAAKMLRATYKAAPRKKWTPVLALLKKGGLRGQGMKETLAPFNAVPQVRGSDLGMVSVDYQLDDAWMLQCLYVGKGNPPWEPGTLTEASLWRNIAKAPVKAPPAFTGVWTIYYANGEKAEELHYRDGLPCGDCISCRDDGSKSGLTRYPIPGYKTEEIDYSTTGRISAKRVRDADKHVWRLTYYKADGSVNYTDEFPGDNRIARTGFISLGSGGCF